MRILIINPNTTAACTESIRSEAESLRYDDCQIDVVQIPWGPPAVETYHDEMVAGAAVVEELVRLAGTYDAAVIACFSDPGLMAARELLSVPVIGIGEASLYTAAMTCSRYSIIASGGKEDIAVFKEIVEKYGLQQKFASVKYLNVGVAGVNFSIIDRMEALINEISAEDGSDCVILGCGAFAGFGRELTRRTGIQVSDGIKQSLAMARMMHDMKSLDISHKEDKIV